MSAVAARLAGFAAPGFESVRAVVKSKTHPWGRGGGGISAYVDGELVLDLWGGQSEPGVPWAAATLAPIASISKGWTACVVHKLVENGALDFTTPICEWWPEFAAHGKQSITLREVFLHSAGVLGFKDQLAILDADGLGANWGDYDAIAAGLADATPAWQPGSKHGYHAVSFGWLAQEVVRRVTGRTIGDIFRTDFAEPLALDSHLGSLGSQRHRVASVLGADLASLPWLQRRLMESMTTRMSDPASLPGIALLADGSSTILDRAPSYIATDAWLEAEVPASNGVTTTRSLAKLFAALAGGGSLGGTTVLAPESVNLMHKVQCSVGDEVMASGMPLALRLLAPRSRPASYGLMANTKIRGKWALGPNPEAFASAGFGGQVVMGDPVANISLASTCTDFTPGLDKIVMSVRDALYAAIEHPAPLAAARR